MTQSRHGLSIGIERINDEFFLSVKAIGKLTHEDYKVITPLVDSALESVKEPKVKAFIDGSELEGWELRAAWDDFKLGLRYGSEFTKIAVLGNKNWHRVAAEIACWFTSGEVQYFDKSTAALAWLDM